MAFVVRLHEGELTIVRVAELEGVDVTLSAAPATIASVVYGGRPLADVEAKGELTIEGNRALAKSFVTLFELPPKA